MDPHARSSVVMVRPKHFYPNPLTAHDNTFQSRRQKHRIKATAVAAFEEVTHVVNVLTDYGVTVHLFEDESNTRPDSVFPNNWFSTHPGGRVAIYPMATPNRQQERRSDVVEFLKEKYRVQEVVDYSGLERDQLFLEGTGAMVLDHVGRIAYVARSARADQIAVERFCAHFGYEPVVFDAVDEKAVPIYHTNVMMCLATDFALVGLSSIVDEKRRNVVAQRIAASGRRLIDLNRNQVRNFAGNALELSGLSGRLLIISTRALKALTAAQREQIGRSCEILPVEIPTIELAGGSVRCMIAEVNLEPRLQQMEYADEPLVIGEH